ncbi:GDSL lipase-like [Nymphaea colorata]|nr:GDSL lipase-like [Nymphaea colorata]
MARFLSLFLSLLSLTDSGRHRHHEEAGRKPGLFIFGDSTVDCGTNNFINTTDAFRANYFPYGYNGYFRRSTGRFSDGRVSPDFIAEYAKLPLIPPFLQPSADFSHGANFASGGAGILSTTNRGLVVDLKTQLKQFRSLKENITKQMQLGSVEAQTWLGSSVYYFSVGNNDLFAGYLLNNETLEKYTIDEFRQLLVEELSTAIQALQEEGARKFIITSLVDLGCLPSVRTFYNGSCYEIATNFTFAYNLAMEQSLANLASAIDISYVWFDLTGFLRMRMNNPEKYGLTHPIDACCGSGLLRGLDTCGGKNGSSYSLCWDPWTHVWFDGSHSPEVVHKQIAETLWEGKDSTVRPTSAKMLFHEDQNMLPYESQ